MDRREFEHVQRAFVDSKDTYKLLYVSAQRLGKAMEQAKQLAEITKGYGSIEILVVPTPTIDQLKAKLDIAVEALRDINENWDCRYVEGDSTLGHSPCQHCQALKALAKIEAMK